MSVLSDDIKIIDTYKDWFDVHVKIHGFHSSDLVDLKRFLRDSSPRANQEDFEFCQIFKRKIEQVPAARFYKIPESEIYINKIVTKWLSEAWDVPENLIVRGKETELCSLVSIPHKCYPYTECLYWYCKIDGAEKRLTVNFILDYIKASNYVHSIT